MKKGFTLVELLSIIVVIGIIAVLVVPQIGKSVNSVKEEQYERLINMIEASGKAYNRKNRDVIKIPVEELKKEKYITTDMINPITNEEIKGCVRVSVNNEGINEYKYYESNDCENRNIVLTVELNGGSSSQTFSSSYEEGTKLKLISPTKAESSFDKWVVTQGDSVLNKDTLIIGSTDTTIYATYTNQPKFTLNLDGGSVSKIYLTQYDSGSNIELESAKKKGTNFVRWEIIEGNGVLSGNTYTQGSENTVLKAIYESCPIGSYNDGNSSSCKACQDGLTTSEVGKTSCDISCDNNSNVLNWNLATYDSSTNKVSGVCSINTCEPCYKNESNSCNAQTTLYVSNSGNDSNGGYEISSPFATINKAYTCPGNLTIKLLSNITQTSQADFNTLNKEVTLTSNEGTYTITRGNGLTSGSIIKLSNEGTLTTTNITFDGNNVTATEPILNVVSSNVNLNSGTIIQNGINNNTTTFGGGTAGGISIITSSTLNVNGAVIKNNKGGKGAGIAVRSSSTLNYNSGTMSNNKAEYGYKHGGAIFVYSSSTAYIKGGTISNNSASDGGAINISESNCTISGGTISNNTATRGGGLFNTSSSNFDSKLTISGGTISGNSSTYGGGVWIGCDGNSKRSSLDMTGGTIKNNTAMNSGAIEFWSNNCSAAQTSNISGGILESNTASSVGGAIHVDGYTVTVSGTTKIQNNKAVYGGGIHCASSGTTNSVVNLNSGTVSNNVASSSGGGVYKHKKCSYSKTGGTLSGNTPQDYYQVS